jgi:hypothetical protein
MMVLSRFLSKIHRVRLSTAKIVDDRPVLEHSPHNTLRRGAFRIIFPDHQSCLEAIGQYVLDFAPEPFVDAEVNAKVFDDGLITLESFYRPERDPSIREVFEIEDAATDFEFAMCFQQLAKLVSTPEKGLFKECNYRLKGDGSYSADYVY